MLARGADGRMKEVASLEKAKPEEPVDQKKLADAWMTLPNTNPMFAGDSPLNYAKRGGIPALLRVRQLLDARRGGR